MTEARRWGYKQLKGRNSVPLSVLIVGPAPPPYGGMALQATALVDRLKQDGVDVEFLATNPRLPTFLARVKGLRTVVQSLLFFWNLCHSLTRRRIVHLLAASHWYFVLRVIPTIVVGKLFGRQVILNYRGGEAPQFFARYRWLVLPSLRLVDNIAVPSRYLQRVFTAYGFSAKVITNFVDLQRFRFRQRVQLQPWLLVNRSLEPLYNVRMAIAAFRLVQAKHGNARLDIVGGGSEETALRRWVEQEGITEVYFHGAVPNEEIPRYLEKADILLNPSNADNMPINLLEAFAAGVPVVTTNVGGIPDLVGPQNAALMVDPGDAASMATQIEFLLQRADEATRLTSRAKAISESANWERVGSLWRDMYRECASPGKAKNANAIG